MIHVIYGTKDRIVFNNILLTIGNFDGVHRGHRKILDRMNAERDIFNGSLTVYTFHPHPRAFFTKEPEQLITPCDEKIALLEKLGVDIIIIEKFTENIAVMDTETFFNEIIVKKLHPKKIYTGANFRFGKNRRGDVEALKGLADSAQIDYERVDSFYNSDGQRVSSSLIRSFIEQGDMKKTADYLGRAYSITGTVIAGLSQGRKINVRTANIDFNNFIAPKDGVYAVTIEYENNEYHGVANIMMRDNKPLLEVHFFDFNDTIYGKRIKVSFIERIRDELIFKTPEDLKKQITEDILKAKKILKISN